MSGTNSQPFDGTDSAVEVLVRLAAADDQSLDKELSSFLRYPYSALLEGKVRQHYVSFDSNSNSLLRRAFGFFLFSTAADRMQIAMDKMAAAMHKHKFDDAEKYGKEATRFQNEATEYLGHESVREFMFDKKGNYRVSSDYSLDSLLLYRTGTTSYIIHNPDKDTALKLTKPRYWGYETIARNTRDYKKMFPKGRYPNVPKVFDAGERFIVMEFVDGVTLREYLERKVWSSSGPDIGAIREIVGDICQILGNLAENRISHLDLSPENILVATDIKKGVSRKIYLIDFGYNYLLGEGVGSTSALIRAQMYLAPELLESASEVLDSPNDFSKSTLLADVYSLGMTILEMLSNHSISDRTKFEALDSIRGTYIGLGEILEELIDPDPERRLFDEDRGSTIFEAIKTRVDSEIEIYEEVYFAEEGGWALALGVFDVVFQSPDVIRKLVEERKVRKKKLKKLMAGRAESFAPDRAQTEETKKKTLIAVERVERVLNWARVAQGIYAVTALAFGYFSYNDLKTGDWVTNLPGRLVAFSFSLVATRYYVNVFSTLSTKGIQSNDAKRIERWLRFSSFYSWLPIWIALTIYPKAWPFCTAVGSIFTVAINYYCYKLAVLAKSKLEQLSDRYEVSTRWVDEFISDYKAWYEIFALCGAWFFVIGVLLWTHVVEDVWVYAILTIIANIKMFIWNCSGTYAAKVRSGLQRSIAVYARALRFENEETTPIASKGDAKNAVQTGD
jgi:serine/threonine protein kinase